jgi:hypothetical protein
MNYAVLREQVVFSHTIMTEERTSETSPASVRIGRQPAILIFHLRDDQANSVSGKQGAGIPGRANARPVRVPLNDRSSLLLATARRPRRRPHRSLGQCERTRRPELRASEIMARFIDLSGALGKLVACLNGLKFTASELVVRYKIAQPVRAVSRFCRRVNCMIRLPSGDHEPNGRWWAGSYAVPQLRPVAPGQGKFFASDADS